MMFKMTTKRLAILSILLALGVVFKSVFSIGDGEFRISFFDIPLFLAGMIAGPFYGPQGQLRLRHRHHQL